MIPTRYKILYVFEERNHVEDRNHVGIKPVLSKNEISLYIRQIDKSAKVRQNLGAPGWLG